MHKTLIALLFLASAAGCGEDPEPPRRTVAPGDAAPAAPGSSSGIPIVPATRVLLDPSLPEWVGVAPAEFKAKFTTSKGDFTIQVTRAWAPRGADRFYHLVQNGYYDGVVFFRVVSGFMAQFGMHPAPQVTTVWNGAKIQDDPVTQSNKRGMVTFATSGEHSRTTQVFINYGDNSRLDSMGFSPFGKVVDGMPVVDSLYSGYGEGAPQGSGPSQGSIQMEGNEYLKRKFPELDFIRTARIVP